MSKRTEAENAAPPGPVREAPAGALLEELLGAASARESDTGGARPTERGQTAPARERAGGAPAAGASRVAYCVDDRHPVLQGRVRVRWAADPPGGGEEASGGEGAAEGGEAARDPERPDPVDGARGRARESERDGSVWLPVLQGVTVRTHDRVLVVRPHGWDEPVVVGVVDGYRRRPEAPPEGEHTLELRRDEAVTVRAEDGTPLIQVRDAGDGPEIRLFGERNRLRLPGDLELSAASLLLRAEAGEVRVEAHDDVVVRGEVIKLN